MHKAIIKKTNKQKKPTKHLKLDRLIQIFSTQSSSKNKATVYHLINQDKSSKTCNDAIKSSETGNSLFVTLKE